MWTMRARTALGSVLLVLCALLAGCGEEKDSTKPGDIVRAAAEDQFKSGKQATVILPTGRLLITSPGPVDSAAAEETRAREEVEAPSGAVLVPITWQYDTWASNRLDGIFEADDTPIVDLVSGDDKYRLPPPNTDSVAGDSFYVVVDGDGKDRSLELSFDGVVQTVNLRTGKVDEGDAAGLYDIDESRLKERSCTKAGTWFDKKYETAEFQCDIIGPVATPYAAGEWAPEGRMWLAVTLTTELRFLTQANGTAGGAARYGAGGVRVRATIDGAPPVSSVSSAGGRDACPIVGSLACGWSKHLIFDVPADDPEQGPLKADVSYRLVLAGALGDWDPPARRTVTASEDIKLWS